MISLRRVVQSAKVERKYCFTVCTRVVLVVRESTLLRRGSAKGGGADTGSAREGWGGDSRRLVDGGMGFWKVEGVWWRLVVDVVDVVGMESAKLCGQDKSYEFANIPSVAM